ncbi:MAG: LLM class flavin-dependent oxidoreductase [SAR324 cluster bacterium]|nr:LLM class flavin-dependent oxidoreductase [SAR324 cluster bacterium]MCZ6558695.1 LLM class flavin-dependent oxidoreductase [SAR324 cluster bacterium]MCZ6843601.1 LLM class flavin-dependent oxidoreductase [SAR324 cluster bacterium]
MTAAPRTGLFLLSPSESTGALERAVWAEQQGFDSLWIPDGGGKMHALTLAAALAMRTSTIRLGLGVVPVFTHSPAVLASSASALAHLAPGRIIMGLGASSHAMIEGWHGMDFVKPLTRVKETALLLRRMLDGERVEFVGETLRSKGFRLNPPPQTKVPIYLAALRPKMLELAGEIADGVILHLAPLQAIPKMLEHIAAGAQRAGRPLEDIEIISRFNVLVTDDMAAGREEFRKFVLGYYSTPVYNKFLAWAGFEQEAESIAEGFKARDRTKTEAALSDEVVDMLGVIGTADACRERVREFLQAGIQTSAIHAVSADPASALRAMEAFAPRNFS